MDILDYDESCLLDEILTNFPDDALLGSENVGTDSWFMGEYLDSDQGLDPMKQPLYSAQQSFPDRSFQFAGPAYEAAYTTPDVSGNTCKAGCVERMVPTSSYIPPNTFGKEELLVGIPAALGTDWYGAGSGSDDELDDDDIDDDCSDPDKSKKKRKRQKSNNPDAELIAQATEENLKLLNLDPNSKEGKKQRRRIRNRMSAQLHRERKKAYISYLEGLVKDREARIIAMISTMDTLSSENERLRGHKFPATESTFIKPEKADGGYASASSNTDGDDSDTNSISSSSDNVSGRNHASHLTFGSSFSLLSVVFMLGFTFFGNSPGDLNASFSGSSLDSFGVLELSGVHLERGSLNEFHNYLPTLGDIGSDNDPYHSSLPQHQWGSTRKLLSVSSDLEMKNSADLNANSISYGSASSAGSMVQYQDFSHQNAASAVTRLPTIATQPERNDMSWISRDPASLPPLPVILPVPTADQTLPNGLSRSKALWKYQDRVLHLFPTHPPSTSTRSSVRPTAEYKRRHLRARGSTALRESNEDEAASHSLGFALDWVTDHHSSSSSSSSSQRIEASSASGYPMHLLGAPDFNWQTQATETTVMSMSHVLMTEGRALLDPSLTLPVPRITKPISESTSSTAEQESPTKPADAYSAISSWRGHASRSTIETQASPRVVSLGVGGSASTGDSTNMLLMLLPASSVRWGKTWGDSAVYNTEALKHGLNVSDADGYGKPRPEAGPDSDSAASNADDESTLWIEIGCSVVRAQLVRNVTMT